MSNVINKRREILFLYDIVDSNPNGDPVDENKPRIDEETGINIVTDVRLKRTIRDYLHYYKNQEIFIIEIRDEKDKLKTKEDRLGNFNDKKEILSKCIDVRLFGATTAVTNKTMTLTGPAQFKYGRSLHRVDIKYLKGTTVMPSGQDKSQGTFTEKYYLPYSLIGFYGIVNENAAKAQDIELKEEDNMFLLEGMWNGTKNLISTSKSGHTPRLLIQVEMKEENYQLGELDKRIKFVSNKNDEEIRDITDGNIDISQLVSKIKSNSNLINKIKYLIDDRVIIMLDGRETTLENAFEGLSIEKLEF